jgi:hypothetical protein
MRKHVPHPVTSLSSPYAELDLLYGGNEKEAMEESMKIACDLREVLQEGENILYVNTLVSELRMAYAMGKRFDHGARRGRNYFVTYCSGEIIDKLALIRYMCEQKNYKYLIITGFELAALNPRHRNTFMGWLRVMRNIGINVILFTLSQPGNFGTLGALRYSARSIAEVGAYLEKSNGEQYSDYEDDAEPVEQVTEDDDLLQSFDEETAEEAIMIEESAEENEQDFADGADATKIYAEIPTLIAEPEDEHYDNESLKTKDLAIECV